MAAGRNGHAQAGLSLESVIDIGCGHDVWLKAFVESGVARIKERDGARVNNDRLSVPTRRRLASQSLQAVRETNYSRKLNRRSHLIRVFQNQYDANQVRPSRTSIGSPQPSRRFDMTARTTDTGLDPIFLNRWSPRAFDGSVMPDADLRTILEAARWAPSAFNYQPWRILYAKREDANWEMFLSLLIPFNQSWASNASVLLFIVTDTLMEGRDGPSPLHSHSFDAGAAWAQLGLQAVSLGYHAHGMTGIEFDKAREQLQVPDRFRVEAAVAIGKRADPEVLPEKMRAGEQPSTRKPIEEIAFAGPFIA